LNNFIRLGLGALLRASVRRHRRAQGGSPTLRSIRSRNRLIETAATVAIEKDPLTVAVDRRYHSLVLREAALARDPVPIPGIGHRSQSVT
jgi:hypothetical protein